METSGREGKRVDNGVTAQEEKKRPVTGVVGARGA